MRKILTAVAIVCVAAFAQAAVVNWQIGFINGPGASGGWDTEPAGATVTAQLLVSASYTGTAGAYALGDLIIFSDGDTMAAGDIADGYGWATTSDSLNGDATYYAQVILTSGESTLKSQIVSFETSLMSGSGDPVFGFAGDVGNVLALPGESLDATYGTFSSSGWSAVPEPTSGLLMLLGMAGLALRRRRA